MVIVTINNRVYTVLHGQASINEMLAGHGQRLANAFRTEVRLTDLDKLAVPLDFGLIALYEPSIKECPSCA